MFSAFTREQLSLFLEEDFQASISADSPGLAQRLQYLAAQAGDAALVPNDLGDANRSLAAELEKFAGNPEADADAAAVAKGLAKALEAQLSDQL